MGEIVRRKEVKERMGGEGGEDENEKVRGINGGNFEVNKKSTRRYGELKMKTIKIWVHEKKVAKLEKL